MRNLWILGIVLLMSSCGHGQVVEECPPVIDCPPDCVAKLRTKRYHLEKFERLCLTLNYAQHLIVNPHARKDVLSALKACDWIYSRK